MLWADLPGKPHKKQPWFYWTTITKAQTRKKNERIAHFKTKKTTILYYVHLTTETSIRKKHKTTSQTQKCTCWEISLRRSDNPQTSWIPLNQQEMIKLWHQQLSKGLSCIVASAASGTFLQILSRYWFAMWKPQDCIYTWWNTGASQGLFEQLWIRCHWHIHKMLLPPAPLVSPPSPPHHLGSSWSWPSSGNHLTT